MNTISSSLSAVQTYAQNLLPSLKIDQETINKTSKIAIDAIQSIGAAIGLATLAIAKICSSLDPQAASTALLFGGFALTVFVLSKFSTKEGTTPIRTRHNDDWATKMSRDDREAEEFRANQKAETEKANSLKTDSTNMHGGNDAAFVKVGTRKS